MEHENVTTQELNNALQAMSSSLSPAAQQQFNQLLTGAREYFLESDTGGYDGDGPRVDFVNGIQWTTLLSSNPSQIADTNLDRG